MGLQKYRNFIKMGEIVLRIKELLSDLYFKVKYPYVKKIFRDKKRIGLISDASVLTYNELMSNMFNPRTYYSEYGQDYYLSSILLNYINHNPEAWVVDIGAGEPEYLSNSRYFEKHYNCKILAIDPIEEFSDLWLELRPKAIFLTSAVGAVETDIELRVPMSNELMLSFIPNQAHKSTEIKYLDRTISLNRLENILDQQDIHVVMLLSINVCGYDFEVLKGTDFNKVEIRCIILQNVSSNLIGSDEIRNYLQERNYVYIARLADSDDVFLHQSMINGIPSWFNTPVTTI